MANSYEFDIDGPYAPKQFNEAQLVATTTAIRTSIRALGSTVVAVDPVMILGNIYIFITTSA
mgnify:FL=1